MSEIPAALGELTQLMAIVVDTDADAAAQAQEVLQNNYFTVRVASNATTTMDLLYAEPPNCLLIDFALLEHDEMHLLRKIKSDNVYGHLPVILLLHQRHLDAGLDWSVLPADDYVLKPYHSQELLSRVNLSLARAQRDIGANPLTGLPGNLAIMRDAEKRLHKGQPFAMGYLDVDNFKAFNDTYGFTRGDEILRMTARIIVNNILAVDEKDCAVGHIGGDDFVFVTPSDSVAAVCERVIQDFDRIVPAFYDEKDRTTGCIEGTDRQGNKQQFPFMSVSIAVVDTGVVEVAHVGDLSARVAQVKKFVKQKPGSVYMIDRRR
jgi:diguanylate cyclase (GGDEF)-like protein